MGSQKALESKSYILLCDALKEWREQSGQTQIQLSVRLSRPQSYISKCESGHRRMDSIEMYEYASACGVSWEEVGQVIKKAIKAGG